MRDFIRKIFHRKRAPLACGFCKTVNGAVFRPTVSFWPERVIPDKWMIRLAPPVRVTLGTLACEQCRGKMAWHNLVGADAVKAAETAFQKYADQCHVDGKATQVHWEQVQ